MTNSGFDKNSDNKKVNSLSNEKISNSVELPIVTFAREYERIVANEVIPALVHYDKERRAKYRLAFLSSAFFVIVGILTLFLPHLTSSGVKLSTLSFMFAFLIWSSIKKKFERKLKVQVMPMLMKAFPNFNWYSYSTIAEAEINCTRIFPKSFQASKSFDDAFRGQYLGVDIDISECEYRIKEGKYTKTIFDGVVVRLKMNKRFKGMTIVRPRNSYMFCEDLKRLNLQEVKLEDIDFCKKYRVFSNDQIESRYLLTTSFIDRFNNMNLNFSANSAFCAFCNEYVYIAPVTSVDLFSLFSLNKSVTNREQFDVMFRQIFSILELVDHFKLDRKIGL